MAYVVKLVEPQAADAVTVVPNAFDVSWTERLNEEGFGTVSFPQEDSALNDKVRTPLNEIRIFESNGTTLRFAFVIERVSVEVLGEAEGGDKIVTVSGSGMGIRLRRAIMYPEFGLNRASSQERLFGIMTNDLNGVEEGGSQVVGFGTQAAPDVRLTNGNPRDYTGQPQEWPDPDAVYLSTRDLTGAGTTGDPWRHPEGTMFFRIELPNLDAGPARIYALMDNTGTIWWDGVKVIQTSDIQNIRQAATADIDTAGGSHNLAVKVVNVNPTTTFDSYALLLLTVVELDDNGEPNGTVLLRSTVSAFPPGGWQGFDTLDKPSSQYPGLNAGIIMNILLDESDVRGVAVTDLRDWSQLRAANGDEASDTDTRGDLWTKVINNYGWMVGTDYLTVMDGLREACGIDWHMTPDRTLQMWQNGRGTDRGLSPASGVSTVSLTAGTNVIEHVIDVESPSTNLLLTRSQADVSEAADAVSSDTFGRMESLLDVGTADAAEEAGETIRAVLNELGSPILRSTTRLTTGQGAEPYVEFDIGDTVVAPDHNGDPSDWRVSAVSVMQENESATVLFDVELEQRQSLLSIDAIADQSAPEGASFGTLSLAVAGWETTGVYNGDSDIAYDSSRQLAYVVVDSPRNFLFVVDVSDPAAPTVSGSLAISDAQAITYDAANQRCFVAFGQSLGVVDVSTPASPTLVGSTSSATNVDTSGVAYDAANDRCYTTAGFSGNRLVVWDVSTPSSPAILGSTTNTITYARGVAYDSVRSVCYVASQDADKLVVVDVSTPASPTILGEVTGTALNGAQDVQYDPDGQVVYVAAAYNSGIAVVDVSTLASPSVIGTVTSTDLQGAYRLVLNSANGHLYVGTGTEAGGSSLHLTVVDISDPTTPSVAAVLEDIIVGAQGLAFDPSRSLLFTASSQDDRLSVIEVFHRQNVSRLWGAEPSQLGLLFPFTIEGRTPMRHFDVATATSLYDLSFAADGTIWVANSTTTLRHFSADGTTELGTITTPASTRCVAVAADGTVWTTEFSVVPSNQIRVWQYSAAGTLLDTLLLPSGYSGSLGGSRTGDLLWLAMFGPDEVIGFNVVSETVTTQFAQANDPTGLAVDPATGDVWMALRTTGDYVNLGPTPTGTPVDTVTPVASSPDAYGIAWHP